MTSSVPGVGAAPPAARRKPQPIWRHRWIADRVPVAVVVAALVVIWYVAAIAMNMSVVRDGFERAETEYTVSDLIEGTLNAERPLVAAPHQVVSQFVDSIGEILESTFGVDVKSIEDLYGVIVGVL